MQKELIEIRAILNCLAENCDEMKENFQKIAEQIDEIAERYSDDE